jgi:large subunit ribosomal protein L13
VDTLSYKTLSSNKLSANKQWFLIDAEGQNLGRFSSKIAKILRGKYKTNFTPHADCGDNVVILNASKIVMTGDKLNKREIFSHTGFPGGQKRITPIEMLAKDGTSAILSHKISRIIY